MVQVHVPQGVEVRVLSWAPPLDGPLRFAIIHFFAFSSEKKQSPGGGIGRRAWFRSMCRKVWRFASSPGHPRFTENPAKSADLAGFFVFAQTAGGRQNLAHDTTGYPIVYSTLSLHRACSWHRIASPHACSSSPCSHSQPWAPTSDMSP